MGIVLDLILLAVVVIFIVDGFKRGAVSSIIDIIGYIIVLGTAIWMATFLADVIFNSFVKEYLVNEINTSLQSTVGQDLNSRIDGVLNAMPKYISNVLGFYGVNSNSLSQTLKYSNDIAATDIVTSIAPIVKSLIKTVSLSVLVVVFMSLFKVLSRTINKVLKLPLLKQVNEILGAVFGVVKCAILVLIVCWLIETLVPMTNPVPKIISPSTIDSTYIFKHIYNNNPLSEMLKNVSFN